MNTKKTMFLAVTLVTCLCSLPGKADDSAGKKGKKKKKETATMTEITVKPTNFISQHPLSPPDPLNTWYDSYFSYNGHELLVYSRKPIKCSGEVKLYGVFQTVTASKYGKEGSEEQFVASSFTCLDG